MERLVQRTDCCSPRRARVVPVILVAALAWGVQPARATPLVIIPTFDSSITGDPNAAAIEATIGTAITFYDTMFTTATATPVDVTIDFAEMGTGLGQSVKGLYKLSYSSFITQLHAASSGDATDTTALAALPIGATNPVTGSRTINVSEPNGRALGFTTPGFVTGPHGGTFDGVVSLNTSLTTPGSPGSTLQYSLFAVTEHEIDEVLGLGSDVGGTGFFADPAPEDLFRYTNTGARSYTTAGDNAYFSLDGTTDLVQFNQDGIGDYGDWHISGTPRVQDAYATPGAFPTLGTDSGTPEMIALDAIGYNLSGPTPTVPEPTTLSLTALGLAGVVSRYRRRRASR